MQAGGDGGSCGPEVQAVQRGWCVGDLHRLDGDVRIIPAQILQLHRQLAVHYHHRIGSAHDLTRRRRDVVELGPFEIDAHQFVNHGSGVAERERDGVGTVGQIDAESGVAGVDQIASKVRPDATIGAGRFTAVPCAGRLGASESYLHLVRVACADGNDIIAFADQDDVWLPEKLASGVAALTPLPQSAPALYCARQVLVDAQLRRVALSASLRRPPGFPAALTQNLATGCTIMLNRAAANLIAASRAPSGTMHDW